MSAVSLSSGYEEDPKYLELDAKDSMSILMSSISAADDLLLQASLKEGMVCFL
jgi:hypothetical protein